MFNHVSILLCVIQYQSISLHMSFIIGCITNTECDACLVAATETGANDLSILPECSSPTVRDQVYSYLNLCSGDRGSNGYDTIFN